MFHRQQVERSELPSCSAGEHLCQLSKHHNPEQRQPIKIPAHETSACKKTGLCQSPCGQTEQLGKKCEELPIPHGDIFTAPPVDADELEALSTEYDNTYVRYKGGGRSAKGLFLKANDALFSAIDQLANYVNAVANGKLHIILLSGFVPTDTTSTRLKRPKTPENVKLKRLSTGQIQALCDHQDIAENYGCIMTEGTPLPSTVHITMGNKLSLPLAELAALNIVHIEFDLGRGRKKLFTGLKPAVTYYFTFYAVNASGASSLSPAISMMCG